MLHLQGKDTDADGASEAKPAADSELEAARKAERERRATKVNSPWPTSCHLLSQESNAKAQRLYRPSLLQTHGCSLVPIMDKCHGSICPHTHLQCAGGSRGGAKGCSSTGVRQAQQALAVSCVCVDQSCLSFTVS